MTAAEAVDRFDAEGMPQDGYTADGIHYFREVPRLEDVLDVNESFDSQRTHSESK